MTFLWPSLLLLLLAVPLTIPLYLRAQKRRQVLQTSFSGFRSDGPQARRNPGYRHHLPPVLFLVGLTILVVALARPQAVVNLPRLEGTLVLVLDVSGSMAAQDVEPSRMEAARAAAREIILSQPETIQIGIVSFSGSGFTVQKPTEDTQSLLATLERLEPQSGTSLGQGILTALNTLALDAGLPPVVTATPAEAEGAQGLSQRSSPEETLLSQLPEGPYPPSVIVLLSDGEDNQSINPLRAAQAAAERTVRIDALGFGTPSGAILEVDGFSMHTALNEAMLQEITQVAGGAYYNHQAALSTANDQDPQAVYANLVPELVVKPEALEITALFAGASILILVLGAALSMLWFNRLP